MHLLHQGLLRTMWTIAVTTAINMDTRREDVDCTWLLYQVITHAHMS